MELIGTEFGEGQLTGVFVRLCLGGGMLFLACAVMTWRAWRGGGVFSTAAAAICSPLYVYRVAPASLQWLSPAQASVRPPDRLIFDGWAIAGLLSLAAMGTVLFLSRGPQAKP